MRRATLVCGLMLAVVIGLSLLPLDPAHVYLAPRGTSPGAFRNLLLVSTDCTEEFLELLGTGPRSVWVHTDRYEEAGFSLLRPLYWDGAVVVLIGEGAAEYLSSIEDPAQRRQSTHDWSPDLPPRPVVAVGRREEAGSMTTYSGSSDSCYATIGAAMFTVLRHMGVDYPKLRPYSGYAFFVSRHAVDLLIQQSLGWDQE